MITSPILQKGELIDMQEKVQTPQNGLNQELLSNLPPEMLAEIISNALQGKTENSRINKISLEDLLKHYKRHVINEGLSDSSVFQIRQARHYLKRFADRRGLTSPDEFRMDHAEEFRYELNELPGFSGRPIGPTYQILLYKRVKALFQFAERNEFITKNPFKNINIPDKGAGRVWTREYTHKMIAGCKKYYRGYKVQWAISTIMAGRYCGQRGGLWQTLRLKDFYYIEEQDRLYFTIRVKIPHSRGLEKLTREVIHKKTKRQLLKTIELARMRGKKDDDLMTQSTSPNGGYQIIRRMLVHTCKKENLEYIPLHGTKRGCITEIGEEGGTAEEACLFVGNRTVEVIRKRYMVFNIDKVTNKIGNMFDKNDRED